MNVSSSPSPPHWFLSSSSQHTHTHTLRHTTIFCVCVIWHKCVYRCRISVQNINWINIAHMTSDVLLKALLLCVALGVRPAPHVCLCVSVSVFDCCSIGCLPEFHGALVVFTAPSPDIPVWSWASRGLKTFYSTNEEADRGCGGEGNGVELHKPIRLIWGPSKTQRASLWDQLARLADHWLLIEAAWSLFTSHSFVIHWPSDSHVLLNLISI